jgi:hypothetical protein
VNPGENPGACAGDPLGLCVAAAFESAPGFYFYSAGCRFEYSWDLTTADRLLGGVRLPRGLRDPYLEIECSRCKSKRDVDLDALWHPPTTFVHDLASRLSKCQGKRRPAATLLQLAQRHRQAAAET